MEGEEKDRECYWVDQARAEGGNQAIEGQSQAQTSNPLLGLAHAACSLSSDLCQLQSWHRSRENYRELGG